MNALKFICISEEHHLEQQLMTAKGALLNLDTYISCYCSVIDPAEGNIQTDDCWIKIIMGLNDRGTQGRRMQLNKLFQ